MSEDKWDSVLGGLMRKRFANIGHKLHKTANGSEYNNYTKTEENSDGITTLNTANNELTESLLSKNEPSKPEKDFGALDPPSFSKLSEQQNGSLPRNKSEISSPEGLANRNSDSKKGFLLNGKDVTIIDNDPEAERKARAVLANATRAMDELIPGFSKFRADDKRVAVSERAQKPWCVICTKKLCTSPCIKRRAALSHVAHCFM